jgi:hypothetical protein
MNEKVLLVYQDVDEYKIESVWASKLGDYYRIENIPFFAKNIAFGDIVSVEDDNGALYFDSLIEASGHSVVRIIMFDENDFSDVTKSIEAMGCSWEGSHIKTLISVDIPPEISYNKVKAYLETDRSKGRFDYQEACLGFK